MGDVANATQATVGKVGARAGLRDQGLHSWPVRVMHWTNALAMVVLIGSGWGIYDDSVIIHGVYFPKAIRLGS
ncbi:MAG: hypothetical protein EKK50_10185, partial [Sphingomonadaceae bacterium]